MLQKNCEPTVPRSWLATVTLRIFNPRADIVSRASGLRVWLSRATGAATVYLESADGRVFPVPAGLQELTSSQSFVSFPTLLLAEHVDPGVFACLVCTFDSAKTVYGPRGDQELFPAPAQAFYLHEGGKIQAEFSFRNNALTFSLNRHDGYHFHLQRHYLRPGPGGVWLLETYDLPFDSYRPVWADLMDILDEKITTPLSDQYARYVAART